jgi:hypothetical protein
MNGWIGGVGFGVGRVGGGERADCEQERKQRSRSDTCSSRARGTAAEGSLEQTAVDWLILLVQLNGQKVFEYYLYLTIIV